MLNPWARVILWAIISIWVILFISMCGSASAGTITIENGTVMLSEEDFRKMTAYITRLEVSINTKTDTILIYKQQYEDARSCVIEAAKKDTSALACFYPPQEYM